MSNPEKYPRINPAVIVLIHRGDELLLVSAHRHPPGRYSLVAGYIEQGESAETAVRREALEEVGVEISQLSYISSQPWADNSKLMLGFNAHYQSGEIRIDTTELRDAQWFHKNQLPDNLPPKETIARQLIDQFCKTV